MKRGPVLARPYRDRQGRLAPRALTLRGRHPVRALLLSPRLHGERDARARALSALRAAGSRVVRLPDGELLVLGLGEPPQPWGGDRVERLEGAACVELAGGVLTNAALDADELALLREANPHAIVLLAEGGFVRALGPSELLAEDPASWLDLGTLERPAVRSLGEPPRELRLLAPTTRPVRGVFGLPSADPAATPAREALIRAKVSRLGRPSGVADVDPYGDSKAGWAAWLGALLGGVAKRLASWSAGTPTGAGEPAHGGKAQHNGSKQGHGGRGLLVVAAAPTGPSWLSRAWGAAADALARLALRLELGTLIGREQARYLDDMLGQFEANNWEEALKRAIPLRDEGGTNENRPPLLSVPRPRTELAITGLDSGSGRSIHLVDDFYEQLRATYRQAAERLIEAGRIEEAAFVRAELLGDSAGAVALLEEHGLYAQAAEVAELRQLEPALIVRLWFLAGNGERALRVARRFEAFAEAVRRLEASGAPSAKTLRLAWANRLAEQGRYLEAVEVAAPLAKDAPVQPLLERWCELAAEAGGAAGARALVRWLGLSPERFEELAPRLVALLAARTAEGRRTRSAVEPLLEPSVAVLAPLSRLLDRQLGLDLAERPEYALAELLKRRAQRLDPLLAADPAPARVTHERRLALSPLTIVSRDRHDVGVLPIHDVALLADGERLLVALGEGGVQLRHADGRVLAHFDEPAHRLVAAPSGERVLALARRGTRVRVARVAVALRRAEPFCELELDDWAPSFDGATWLVTRRGSLERLDVEGDEPQLTDRVPLGGTMLAFGTSTNELSLLVRAAAAPARGEVTQAPAKGTVDWLSVALPELRLRRRVEVADPGELAAVRGERVFALGGDPLTAVTFDGPAGTVRSSQLGRECTPLAVALSERWGATLHVQFGAAVATLFDLQSLTPRLAIVLGDASPPAAADGTTAVRTTVAARTVSAPPACLRLSDSELVVADCRGRVLRFELERGELVSELRLR